MRDRIRADLCDLMLVPGLSGHEDRVRRAIRDRLPKGVAARSDRPGNLIVTFKGDPTAPSAMVRLFEAAADGAGIPLQRAAQVGILTDLSYVQLVGQGAASIDIGFPMRYSHSPLEMCDLGDLEGLTCLILAALPRIGANFPLNRDEEDA